LKIAREIQVAIRTPNGGSHHVCIWPILLQKSVEVSVE